MKCSSLREYDTWCEVNAAKHIINLEKMDKHLLGGFDYHTLLI